MFCVCLKADIVVIANPGADRTFTLMTPAAGAGKACEAGDGDTDPCVGLGLAHVRAWVGWQPQVRYSVHFLMLLCTRHPHAQRVKHTQKNDAFVSFMMLEVV